jgi:DNA modification methylase
MVWGGRADCQHEWQEEIFTKEHHHGQGGSTLRGGNISSKESWINGTSKIKVESGFCCLCGAWRGQLGLEPHPQLYISHMVSVCRELKRVLKRSGSLWLNMGDTYFGGGGKTGRPDNWEDLEKNRIEAHAPVDLIKERNKLRSSWLQPKQLLLIPSRLAIALQEDDYNDEYSLRELSEDEEREFISRVVFLVTYAIQRPREGETISQRIREEMETFSSSTVQEPNGKMVERESRKISAIQSKILLAESREGDSESNKRKCEKTSQTEIGSTDTLWWESTKVCMLWRNENTVPNNSPCLKQWLPTQEGNSEYRQHLRMVETCKISSELQRFMHELQLCGWSLRKVSASRRKGKYQKGEIPKCLFKFFQLEKTNSWILRNDVVWNKPNHMPSSVRDRLTNGWEHVFFFVKERRYFFDLDAIREPQTASTLNRDKYVRNNPATKYGASLVEGQQPIFRETRCEMASFPLGKNPADVYAGKFDGFAEESEKFGSPRARTQRLLKQDSVPSGNAPTYRGFNKRWKEKQLEYESKYRESEYGQQIQGFIRTKSIEESRTQSRIDAEKLFPNDPKKQQEYINYIHDHQGHSLGKNPSDFWRITTQPFKGAHFAVYPMKLVEMPIKACCPQWICDKCGKPRTRITNTVLLNTKGGFAKSTDKIRQPEGTNVSPKTTLRGIFNHITVGWSDCGCNAGWHSGVVLDPFLGSGTTMKVAQKLGRSCVGIELSREYCEKIVLPRCFMAKDLGIDSYSFEVFG